MKQVGIVENIDKDGVFFDFFLFDYMYVMIKD